MYTKLTRLFLQDIELWEIHNFIFMDVSNKDLVW